MNKHQKAFAYEVLLRSLTRINDVYFQEYFSYTKVKDDYFFRNKVIIEVKKQLLEKGIERWSQENRLSVRRRKVL